MRKEVEAQLMGYPTDAKLLTNYAIQYGNVMRERESMWFFT